MSDVPARRPVRRARSIYQVHYGLQRRQEDMAKPLVLPTDLDVQQFDLQVAGHQQTENKKYFGLLQCSNGTILKPILKHTQQREVDFYNRLWSSDDPHLVQLRQFVPEYRGCTHYTYNGHEQRYIMLEDMTQRMVDQCIMDVKIGRRTWDPLASEHKIKSEQSKYVLSRQQLGFCIPGYQVLELATGQLRKRGKEHGKSLDRDGVADAIITYLNGRGRPLCRTLIVQFLQQLWRIQRWAREQTALRIYCASLLLLYDAHKLRQCCQQERTGPQTPPHPPISRRRSAPSGGSPLGGSLTARGPVYRKLTSVPLSSMAAPTLPPPPPLSSPWTEALDHYNNSHSTEHNYEDNLCKIKMDYRAMLDQLSSDSPNPNPWGTVKIIDFAHAFFNEEGEMGVDENFKEGIDNFVALFEKLLADTTEHNV